MLVFHSKTPSRVTVVGEHQQGVLKIAVARCSNKDQFCRRTGRSIASTRLKSSGNSGLHSTYSMSDCSVSEFVNIAKQVAVEVSQTMEVYDSGFIAEPLPFTTQDMTPATAQA